MHLDALNQLDYITGATDRSARKRFFYVSDDGDLTALRFDNWKIMFLEQRARDTVQVWIEPYVELRTPKIYNLRLDPFERADETSNTYFDRMISKAWLVIPAQQYVAQMLTTLAEFPARQDPASFSVDKVLEKLKVASGGVLLTGLGRTR